MLRALYGGSTVALFDSVDTLYLDGSAMTMGSSQELSGYFNGLEPELVYNLSYGNNGLVSLSVVPEPTTATLSLLALAALAARRRRK